MTGITLYAPAKINWSLDIVGQRENGYHELNMLMQNIDLYDVVKMRYADRDNLILSGLPVNVPPERNIAYTAWKMLKGWVWELIGESVGLEIEIEKHIPVAGGLAGGSVDAAAVLIGINELFSLGMTASELAEIGLELGADLPFCLHGGLAAVSGIGERVERIGAAPCRDLVLVNPGIEVWTWQMYHDFDALPPQPHCSMEAVRVALQSGDNEALRRHCANHLEQPAFAAFPAIAELKQRCLELGLPALMSGSGSSVWALAEDRAQAEQTAELLRRDYPFACAVRTIDHGITFERG